MLPENEIEIQLAGLRAVEAPAGTAEAAAQAARRAIACDADRKRRRRMLLRVSIPSGLAACVAAGLLLTSLMQGERTVSAAQRLEEAATRSGGYAGWTHSTTVYPPSTLQLPFSRQEQPLTAVTPYVQTNHNNVTGKIFAEVRQGGAIGMMATFYDVGKREITMYDQHDGCVRIGWMDEGNFDDAERRERSPFTLRDMLLNARQLLGREPFSVKETPDGEEIRYDMQMFASKEEQARFEKEHFYMFGADRMAIWVGKDKLITRWERDEAKTTMTYGPPEIRDVYDLGVPRDARVVDARPTGEFKEIAARLDERVRKGLGDYVALLTQYAVNDTGQFSGGYGLQLLASQGDKWLAIRYGWSPPTDNSRQPRLKELPADWSLPDLAALIPVLRRSVGVTYDIGEGTRHWSSGVDGEGVLSKPRSIAERYLARDRANNGVMGGIWSSTNTTGVGRPWMESSLLRDEAHPTLIGIRSVSRLRIEHNGGPPLTTEVTRWIDPARDDVPVEEVTVSYEKILSEPRITQRKRYLEFAQLPGGHWYPTRWREEVVYHYTQPLRQTTEYRLQIRPDLRLEDTWFAMPAVWPPVPAQ